MCTIKLFSQIATQWLPILVVIMKSINSASTNTLSVPSCLSWHQFFHVPHVMIGETERLVYSSTKSGQKIDVVCLQGINAIVSQKDMDLFVYA
jgi:hypothetical protein